MEFTIKIWVTKDGGLPGKREKGPGYLRWSGSRTDQQEPAGKRQEKTNRRASKFLKGAKRRKILYHKNIPSLYLESQHRRHGEQRG